MPPAPSAETISYGPSLEPTLRAMPLSTSLAHRQRHHHTSDPNQPRWWHIMMGSRSPRRPRLPPLPPMRRVRGDRDDYDYPGLDDLFQDLTIDSQDPRIRRMLHHQFAEGYGFDHRFFDQNRSSDEHRNSGERRNPPRPNINSDHGFERGLTLTRPGTAAIPFRRAFKDLHRELVQAEEWYNACLTEYDNDVQPIRNYSSVEDLTNIWAAKVRGEGPTNNGRGR